MSTVGFQVPTPASGATLNVGQPATFRIGVTADDGMAESAVVVPVVTAGTASIELAEAQAIDDSVLPGADYAEWVVTPTAAGALTVDVRLREGEMTIDGGAPARATTRS